MFSTVERRPEHAATRLTMERKVDILGSVGRYVATIYMYRGASFTAHLSDDASICLMLGRMLKRGGFAKSLGGSLLQELRMLYPKLVTLKELNVKRRDGQFHGVGPL